MRSFMHFPRNICGALKRYQTLFVALLCLPGCAGPSLTGPSLQGIDIQQNRSADEIALFDLEKAPQDTLLLEAQLLSYLQAGTYDTAIALGLNHLEPQFLGEGNLRLLIQAARLEGDFDLAHDLIRLGRLLYPEAPAFDIEDRLLKLAEGKCRLAVEPMRMANLSDAQRQILAQIRAICLVDWTSDITISAWVGKPLQSTANISHIDPVPDSLIHQTCAVFAVGCGAVPLSLSDQTKTQINGQAIWHLQHRRTDRLTEHIRLLLQRGQIIKGAGSEDRVFAQYAWEMNRHNLLLEPYILIGAQKKNTQNLAEQSQTMGSVGLNTEIPTGRHAFLTSSARHSIHKQDVGEIQHRAEETGFRILPHERVTLSYATGQETRLVPNHYIGGNSTSVSEAIIASLKISDRVQATLSRRKREESFEGTLYYLTSPHRIEEQKLTMRMDISIKTGITLWIETDDVISRSADPVYDFADTRLTLGLRVNL